MSFVEAVGEQKVLRRCFPKIPRKPAPGSAACRGGYYSMAAPKKGGRTGEDMALRAGGLWFSICNLSDFH